MPKVPTWLPREEGWRNLGCRWAGEVLSEGKKKPELMSLGRRKHIQTPEVTLIKMGPYLEFCLFLETSREHCVLPFLPTEIIINLRSPVLSRTGHELRQRDHSAN